MTRRRGAVAAIVVLFASSLVSSPALATRASTRLVSKALNGEMGNNNSDWSSLSSTGRYVTFASAASNLVADDTNGVADIFVRDMVEGRTQRVSVTSDGAQANNYSTDPVISANGRIVAFWSIATNLVANDTNGGGDIFVHNLRTGKTKRVNVSPTGEQGSTREEFALSANGRFVAFVDPSWIPDDHSLGLELYVHDRWTNTTTLVIDGFALEPTLSGDGRYVGFLRFQDPGVQQAFVIDRATGVTELASVNNRGEPANDNVDEPTISADGRFVAFSTWATNLVRRDRNGTRDIFVRKLHRDRTVRASVTSDGVEADQASYGPWLSQDGHYVVFYSAADRLSPDYDLSSDVFLHDLRRRTTKTVSTNCRSEACGHASLSGDGAFVAYTKDHVYYQVYRRGPFN